MSILDNVKQQMQSPLQQPTSVGGQTESIRSLLRAKSGKASVPDSGPKQSSIQEKMAEQQTKLAGQQLQQQGQIAAAQLGEQEADIQQRTEQQEATFLDRLTTMQDDLDRRSSQLLDQFSRGQKSLQSDRDLMDLEQAGFISRLQNKQYIDRLQREGQQLRLDNSLDFAAEFAKQKMGEYTNLFRDELDFKRMMDMDDREWAREVSEMDINDALDVADAAARQTSSEQMFSGVSSLISTATDLGDDYANKRGIWKKDKGAP